MQERRTVLYNLAVGLIALIYQMVRAIQNSLGVEQQLPPGVIIALISFIANSFICWIIFKYRQLINQFINLLEGYEDMKPKLYMALITFAALLAIVCRFLSSAIDLLKLVALIT